MDFSRLFPKVDREYTGSKIPFYFLVLIAVVSTVRSLIHMFATDGGASSIAGISVNVEGGWNIIAMFSQWGASQLILAIFYWLTILRYRFLTPAMLGIIVIEQLLRIVMGQLKPLNILNPPPGAIGTDIILPLAVITLIWSLWKKNK